MSKFPLIEEIQDLKQKHRRSPERRKKINDLIEESLDYNGDKMRNRQKLGQRIMISEFRLALFLLCASCKCLNQICIKC